MIFYLPLAFFGKSNVKIMKKVDEEFELWEGGLEIIDFFHGSDENYESLVLKILFD